MNDSDLQKRLAALEARAPGGHGRPELPQKAPGKRSRLFAPIGLAPALVLVIAATALAGGAILGGVVGLPGAENPGQPLVGANLECMSPPDAAAYLVGHGFGNVVWQIERGSLTAKGAGSMQQQSPPEHGFVVPGAFLGDGQLIMIVDQRAGATGVGPCFGEPMP